MAFFKVNIAKIILSLVASAVAYLACYYIAQTYYFDKFFYYKNQDYGYWIPNTSQTLADFGPRAKDLINLTSTPSSVLGTTDHTTYKIIIIGDSLVWGQGLTNDQRFATQLEKKLNRIRPTTVISLGGCGDNIFDNYQKYLYSIETFGPANLYIFALYNNDLVFNTDDRYQTNQQLIPKLSSDCQNSPPIYSDSPNPEPSSFDHSTQNYCSVKKLLPLLPTSNSLYIDLGSINLSYPTQDSFSETIKPLPVINLTAYNRASNYNISQHELHPSFTANKIFTQVLYDKITTTANFKNSP